MDSKQMDSKQDETAQALAYFRQNPLRHVVHLKYLVHHPGKFDSYYVENDGSTAALLSGSVRTTVWDQGQYPDLELMLLPSASHERAARLLVKRVREKFSVPTTPTLFKFCDPYSKAAFIAAYRLQPARSYISFTTPHNALVYQRHPEVVVGSILDDARTAFYQQNSYTLVELQRFIKDGALTFAVYEGSTLVSTCLAYRNFGGQLEQQQIWEIGGVRTADWARRKGYARHIVETALHELAIRGFTPRYHVEVINTPSIALAQSLGLQECVRIEHFVTVPATAPRREDAEVYSKRP
jgi:hypothetical protein